MTPKQKRNYWAKVDKRGLNDCWEWTAFRNPAGYGMFGLSDKSHLAHRVGWMLENGPIPKKRWVLHRCDNPGCVNPDHLFLGTPKDNSRDMSRKGRSRTQKLTQEDYRAILADSRLHREIAKDYGVVRSQISNIKRGEIYAAQSQNAN